MPLTDEIPAEYQQLSLEELTSRIAARKRELGEELVILGHHYQADEVIRFADFRGDSLKLAQLAAGQDKARFIVFCGVHFMAESADIVSSREQVVCLPSMLAGCSMADMAEPDAVEAALSEMADLTAARILPVTYVNSTAVTKAITGRAGGACCTSSNVQNVFQWALREQADGGGGGEKIFAIPDQHLGRNTAFAMGYKGEDCALYDPMLPAGGLSADDVNRATFLLWKGHCYVHQLFKPEDVRSARRENPNAKIIVHPECPREVVELADASGSTQQIIQAIGSAPAGSAWYVGTESALVERLACENPDKQIRVLSGSPAICRQMKRVDLPHLLWVLDGIATGQPVNQVSVDREIAGDAKLALDRMIAIRARQDITQS